MTRSDNHAHAPLQEHIDEQRTILEILENTKRAFKGVQVTRAPD